MAKLVKRFFKSSKLFELLMIFAGITLSMQFDNWNESRKLKIKELELLSAIYIDLSNDLTDVKSVIQSMNKYNVRPMAILDSCLKCPEPLKEKSEVNLLQLPLGGNYMDQNNGAYECFKYDGATLLKNNRLKVKLFDYYESRLNWLKMMNKGREEFCNSYIIPIFMKYTNGDKHISFDNYLKLRKDQQSLKILSIWQNLFNRNLKLHKKLLPFLEALRQEMEQELVVNGKDPQKILEESKAIG